jgi:hypothetical protein
VWRWARDAKHSSGNELLRHPNGLHHTPQPMPQTQCIDRVRTPCSAPCPLPVIDFYGSVRHGSPSIRDLQSRPDHVGGALTPKCFALRQPQVIASRPILGEATGARLEATFVMSR